VRLDFSCWDLAIFQGFSLVVSGFRTSIFRDSSEYSGEVSNAILRKGHRCTSVLHRAVRTRLVPWCSDFLKNLEKLTSREILTFSSFGNEEKVCGGPEGQAGRVRIILSLVPPRVSYGVIIWGKLSSASTLAKPSLCA
jgi:hypothetical protein